MYLRIYINILIYLLHNLKNFYNSALFIPQEMYANCDLFYCWKF